MLNLGPCEYDGVLTDRSPPQDYTFTLTQGDGTRMHGFCRRFLPAPEPGGPKQRLPQAMCMIWPSYWTAFFFKVRHADPVHSAQKRGVHTT